MRCDFCGREWIFVWPELWPYRYEGKVFCSENCKICDSTLIKLGRGKKKLMSRMKKDGTPARKPGPKAKKRIETPEGEIVTTITKEPPKPLDGGPVEKIEMPERKIESALTPENLKKAAEAAKEMLEEARKEKEKFFGLPSYIDGFEINGISGQFGIYRASSEHNYFEFVPFGGELCMNPGDWHEQIEELNRAAKVLGVKL